MPVTKSKRKQVNGLIRGVKVLAFGLVLAAMGFIGLLWFARPDTSEVEKRSLTPFPEVTWASFWDGSFFKEVDTWYADTFPLREGLISGSDWLKNHYGLRGDQIVTMGEAQVADEIPADGTVTKPEIDITPAEPLEDGTITELGEMQGGIYITNNSAYGLYYFVQSGADTMAATMNKIYADHKDKIDLYVMVAPMSSSVMLDKSVIDDMGCSDERETINYLFDQMDEGIHKVNVVENMRIHNAEYLYFRTDHHWTQLGAYYAYQVFCKEKGIYPKDLKEYTPVEYPGFLGTYYANTKSPALAGNPDTVVTYTPLGTNDMGYIGQDGQYRDWTIITDVTGWAASGLYGAFVGGDRPLSMVHNPNVTDGSAVMVVKDSYGNAFVPWLVDQYEYIYWVDYRYTSNTISQMVEEYNVQDVIFEMQSYNSTSDKAAARYAAIGQ